MVDRQRTLESACDPDHLLPVGTVAELVAAAALALDEAHRRGVVHGHVGPWSLVRVGDLDVRVGDSRLEGRPLGSLAPEEASYLSPEQVRGAPLDARSDLFSLGAVLHNLLTGERPFEGDSTSSILYRIVHEPARQPAGRVPEALRAFLEMALAKRPEGRFASGAEFADVLRTAASSLESPAPVPAAAGVAAAPRPGQASARPAARRPTVGRRTSVAPYVVGLVLVVVVVAGGLLLYGDRLDLSGAGAPPEVWRETRVRAEPAEAAVFLDGMPLDVSASDVVRFPDHPPFPVLSASLGCRRIDRRIEPGDAGGEIVLVLDPLRATHAVEPDARGISVFVNGQAAGTAPVDVDLDLCRENRVELRARGFRSASVVIPQGATPGEAGRLLDGIGLEAVPRGRLRLPDAKVELEWWLDGDRLDTSVAEWELDEGSYDLRSVNAFHFVDATQKVRIEGGRTTIPEPKLPAMSTLVVQAFPANCRAWVRRPGGSWSSLGETPAERAVAVGGYEVKVEFKPTGETRVERVDVKAGATPPVRVAFRAAG